MLSMLNQWYKCSFLLDAAVPWLLKNSQQDHYSKYIPFEGYCLLLSPVLSALADEYQKPPAVMSVFAVMRTTEEYDI